MRSIVEASAHMFEDAAALDTRVEERQCAAAASLDTDLDPSVVKALLRLPRDPTSWTLVEDITFLELISACVNKVKHIDQNTYNTRPRIPTPNPSSILLHPPFPTPALPVTPPQVIRGR